MSEQLLRRLSIASGSSVQLTAPIPEPLSQAEMLAAGVPSLPLASAFEGVQPQRARAASLDGTSRISAPLAAPQGLLSSRVSTHAVQLPSYEEATLDARAGSSSNITGERLVSIQHDSKLRSSEASMPATETHLALLEEGGVAHANELLGNIYGMHPGIVIPLATGTVAAAVPTALSFLSPAMIDLASLAFGEGVCSRSRAPLALGLLGALGSVPGFFVRSKFDRTRLNIVDRSAVASGVLSFAAQSIINGFVAHATFSVTDGKDPQYAACSMTQLTSMPVINIVMPLALVGNAAIAVAGVAGAAYTATLLPSGARAVASHFRNFFDGASTTHEPLPQSPEDEV